jgi:hypothetical protein
LNTVGDAQPMPTRSVSVSENGYRFKMADVFFRKKKEDGRRFRIIFVRASIFGNAKKILIDRFFQNKKKLIDRFYDVFYWSNIYNVVPSWLGLLPMFVMKNYVNIYNHHLDKWKRQEIVHVPYSLHP